jgi:hypothetical protein
MGNEAHVEKRYQVFVNSAFAGMAAERRSVVTALLELNCRPLGMDVYGAADAADWSLIRSQIDDCDYFLTVLGANYRTLDLESLDRLEREYGYAIAQSKPCLAFLRPGDRLEPEAGGGYSFEAARLQAFRDRLETGAWRPWSSEFELAGAVSRGCAQLIQSTPAEGWVRAGHAKTPEDFDRLARLTGQVEVLEKELADLRAANLANTGDLAQGGELVQLEYSLHGDPAVFHIVATWTELFGVVGMLAVELPTKREIATELSAWIGTRANSFDVAISPESIEKIKLQFFTLGLVETRFVPHGRVWGLTDRGRELLGRLRAQKRNQVEA